MNRIAATAALAALVFGGGAAAQEVNLYNARHYNTDRALYENFTKKTGIRINMVEGEADPLIQRIKAEGAGGKADLLITVDAGRLHVAVQEGVFEPLRNAVLEGTVPAHLRDPEGRWFGLSTRARVLVYARDRVKPADLSTYEALADPRWKGKVAIRSSTNVYNMSLVGSILEANGPEKTEAWARGLVANFARAPKGGDRDQISAVAAGEADVAVSNTYYLAGMMASAKPEERAVAEKVAVFFPNQGDRGTHVNVSGIGLLKTAPNRENAIKLMEYLVSPEAQRYFADGNYEYPVHPEVKPHAILEAWGGFKQDPLNAAKYAANGRTALEIMDRAGWK